MPAKTMALAFTALMLAPAAARAADSFDINVILPMTGGASFVGKGQHDSLEALAAVVNKASGIGGKGQQGSGGRVEEQVIEATLIVQEQRMEQIGNGKDDVEVRDG